ncbi:hypothetical protein BP00DRAFT_133390 [Aspergillus indologenus CBS 114.80]|uniref:Uncharacterized protein n=1 Tax=Aspergillus indologenus CBS 114.80 TaxID=1450541 RepID=A0A2V5HMF8_9EURO|nr:hypothetical protein BP00DRAFT_133390 [Aspergillus indologenus CBS 114.80]
MSGGEERVAGGFHPIWRRRDRQKMARRLFGLFSFPSPSPGVAVRSLQPSSVSARPNENLRGFLWLSAFLGFYFSNPAGLIRCRTCLLRSILLHSVVEIILVQFKMS